MPFVYIEKDLRYLSSAHEKWGQKQKCCVYNFVNIYIYIQLFQSMCTIHRLCNHMKFKNHESYRPSFLFVFRLGMGRYEILTV